MLVVKRGCRTMDFTKRPMTSSILIEESAMQMQTEFDLWTNLAIEFIVKQNIRKKRNNALEINLFPK